MMWTLVVSIIVSAAGIHAQEKVEGATLMIASGNEGGVSAAVASARCHKEHGTGLALVDTVATLAQAETCDAVWVAGDETSGLMDKMCQVAGPTNTDDDDVKWAVVDMPCGAKLRCWACAKAPSDEPDMPTRWLRAVRRRLSEAGDCSSLNPKDEGACTFYDFLAWGWPTCLVLWLGMAGLTIWNLAQGKKENQEAAMITGVVCAFAFLAFLILVILEATVVPEEGEGLVAEGVNTLTISLYGNSACDGDAASSESQSVGGCASDDFTGLGDLGQYYQSTCDTEEEEFKLYEYSTDDCSDSSSLEGTIGLNTCTSVGGGTYAIYTCATGAAGGLVTTSVMAAMTAAFMLLGQ